MIVFQNEDLRLKTSAMTNMVIPAKHMPTRAGDDVHGMMKVVTDASERDPEREDDDGELNEGSEDLQDTETYVDEFERTLGKVGESGLEIHDEKGAAIEAEGGVSGEEGESRFVQLLFGIVATIALQPHADVVFLFNDKFFVSVLVLAQLLGEIGLA